MKQLLIIRADGSRLVLDYSQVQSIVRQNGKLNILLKDGSIISLEIGDQLALEAMQTESLETSPPKIFIDNDISDAELEQIQALLSEVETIDYSAYFQAGMGLLGVGAITAAALHDNKSEPKASNKNSSPTDQPITSPIADPKPNNPKDTTAP
ncbi:hypothetical protein, partial [Moraxella canis]